MGEGGYFDQMFPYIHKLVFCIKVSFYNKYIILILGLFIHVYQGAHPYRMADTLGVGYYCTFLEQLLLLSFPAVLLIRL